MSNIYFPDEEITFNGLYFVCYMIERVARNIRQRNRYVVERMGAEGLAVSSSETDLVQSIINVYASPICDAIDNYNSSAYYEPSYIQTRAYHNGGF